MIHTHSLDRAARYYPSLAALACDGSLQTFHELHERVAGIAAALAGHGFRAGDRLALLLPNEPEYIELVYACAWLGLIAVPLNTRLAPPELDHILTDATPRGLIRHSSLPTPTARVPWELVLDKEPLRVPCEPGPEPIYDPDLVLALIYTSGTTGRPKGVVLTHGNVLANVHFLNYWIPYTAGGVFLHAAPMFHIIDFPLLFAAPAFGACQVTIPKFSAQGFCDAVEARRVTHTMLVPTMINMLTQFEDVAKYDLSSLERIAYGGSPMAPELVNRIRKILPNVKLVEGYGLSETGFLTALLDDEHMGHRLLSCGRPCPGIDVRVVDESGNEVQRGTHGELVSRGANVMRGYWNNPDETSRAFRAGLFRTGDVGYQDADGFFYILDRLKDMIVTGGENVYCGEVEAVIYSHPAVREAAVFGIPDSKWGELVTACVVLKGGKTVTAEELIAFCRRLLANYKLPRRVEFSTTDLPKSGSGKVLKRLLRDRFWKDQKRVAS